MFLTNRRKPPNLNGGGGGGCVPYKQKADIHVELGSTSPYDLWQVIQETEFVGDGCNAPSVVSHHCYPAFTTYGVTISTSWCDSSTDSYGDTYGYAGFYITQYGIASVTERLTSKMPEDMYAWTFGDNSCTPNGCD